MGFAITHEGVAAIERNVEPLVAVGGPGVCAVGSVEEVAEAWAGRAPEAEGSVDVDPCAELFRDGYELHEVVEGADVEITGLKDHDCRLGGKAFKRFREGVFAQPTLCIYWQTNDV